MLSLKPISPLTRRLSPLNRPLVSFWIKFDRWSLPNVVHRACCRRRDHCCRNSGCRFPRRGQVHSFVPEAEGLFVGLPRQARQEPWPQGCHRGWYNHILQSCNSVNFSKPTSTEAPKVEIPGTEETEAPKVESTEAAEVATTPEATSETATSPKERRKSSFFAGFGKKQTKTEEVKSDSEETEEPKEKTAKPGLIAGLIRKASHRGGKTPEAKEVSTPAAVAEETEPTTEAVTKEETSTEAVKEETAAPVVAEEKAEEKTAPTIGDVVPEAPTVGSKPTPVAA